MSVDHILALVSSAYWLGCCAIQTVHELLQSVSTGKAREILALIENPELLAFATATRTVIPIAEGTSIFNHTIERLTSIQEAMQKSLHFPQFRWK